jgi:hypothetical protein
VLWNIFRIAFSNSLPAVNKRQIGRKIFWKFGSLQGFGNVIVLLLSEALENGTAEGSD